MSSETRPSWMVTSSEVLGRRGGSKEVGEGMWCGKCREEEAVLRDVRAAAMCAKRVDRF